VHTSALESLLPVQRFAAQTQRNINTAYIARYSPQCQQESSEIANSNPAASAYIFVNGEYTPKQIKQFFPSHWPLSCQVQDFASLCTLETRAHLQ
jgi:hypothetical protein